MTDKKEFVKPELIKFDKPLDEVTLWQCGTGCVEVMPPTCTSCNG
jgi:hypothetical protein